MIRIVTAVIAEFNPLHKGHEFLIRSLKASGAADGIIVVLSSAFTQRGSPAITDKFIRSRMAMGAGADLVLELPFMFACSAGQDFARGAVSLIARSGLADSLAFGMEDTSFPVMALADEMLGNAKYHVLVREHMSRGASYSKASALALEAIMPGSFEFVSHPNNMLALSYVMNTKKHGMKVIPVRRRGSYSSRAVRDGELSMMPEWSREILEGARRDGRVADEGRLWPLVQGVLIRSRPEELRRIHGIDEGIEGLFLKHYRDSRGLDDFIGRCVCSRYTRAHIRRRLIYILLGLDRWEVSGAMRGGVPYARVLAFNQRGREILRRRSGLKVITRLGAAEGRRGKFFAQVEFKASGLYELLVDNPDVKRETQRVLQF